MSRFCMYCGRELEKDEKCGCSGSVAARKRREETDNSDSDKKSATASQTAKDSNAREKKENKKREKTKREWKRPDFGGAKKVNQFGKGNFFEGFAALIKGFFKNPVYTVTNPGMAGKAESIVIVGIVGIVMSLVVFFSTSGISRSILAMVSRVIGFKGSQGFAQLGNMLLNMLTFTAFSYIQFFVLAGIFYLIQKFILRMYTRFWDVAVRFAICMLPIACVGVVGIVISFFSMQTVIMMLMAAVIMAIVLSYEALKDLWQPLFSDRLVYIMALGYFVYFSLCINLFMGLLTA